MAKLLIEEDRARREWHFTVDITEADIKSLNLHPHGQTLAEMGKTSTMSAFVFHLSLLLQAIEEIEAIGRPDVEFDDGPAAT